MQESVFTKIIRGEVPCHKIYEDERVIAFLDINPLTPGHTLVIPKEQIDELWDVDDELYQYLMKITKMIAERQREILKPRRVGMAVEGFEVSHAHIHVFPLNNGLHQTIAEHAAAGIKEPDHDSLATMAKKLAF